MGKIYRVFVVGLKGEKFAVDISHSETEFDEMLVSKFKEKLLEKLPREAASADNLYFIFANEQLEDGKKFTDYKIMNNSTILMVLRLPGGMEQ